ncbi:MAG: hypothetical protein JWN78_1463 [Bacteroidota bacterium]|nr:hypothetical protein [Bacteroidota bacterium]
MKKLTISLFIISFTCLVIFNQCKISNGKVTVDVDAKPFEKLSEYHFFKGNLKDLIPNDKVLPYDLITTLFSDYAKKARFVWMPEGTSAKYNKTAALDFPVGTVLIKNFYYSNDFRDDAKGRKILETRLLVRRKDKWDALDYEWNDDQTEGTLNIVGDDKKVDWINAHGVQNHTNFLIPNKNQCKGCHSFNETLIPIGPKIRNMNRDVIYAEGKKNQLDKWREVGYLTGYNKADNKTNKLAQWDDPTTGTVEERAKAYLEVNCSNCHRKEGPANTSGLYLLLSEKNPESWGVMKSPVAAGRASGNSLYDVVPGKPEESILPYRMNSADPEIMMPELGRRLIHVEAVALIKQWIAEMK